MDKNYGENIIAINNEIREMDLGDYDTYNSNQKENYNKKHLKWILTATAIVALSTVLTFTAVHYAQKTAIDDYAKDINKGLSYSYENSSAIESLKYNEVVLDEGATTLLENETINNALIYIDGVLENENDNRKLYGEALIELAPDVEIILLNNIKSTVRDVANVEEGTVIEISPKEELEESGHRIYLIDGINRKPILVSKEINACIDPILSMQRCKRIDENSQSYDNPYAKTTNYEEFAKIIKKAISYGAALNSVNYEYKEYNRGLNKVKTIK